MAIPWHRVRRALRRTWSRISSDRISLIAAGCAFWATLALFPAISMLISIYGLVLDPKEVEPHLEVLRNLVPAPAFSLIAQRVHTLVEHGRGQLGLSLLVSTLIAFWSASTGTKSMLSALNLAYDQAEWRGFLRFQAIGLLMTLCGIFAAMVAAALLVFLPVAIGFLGLNAHASSLLRLGSFGVLVVFVGLGMSLLYRFGPSGEWVRRRWITAGSALATLLWLAASVLLSFYVTHVARYDVLYGPLGAVAGIMMWFWVSAYAVLLGAELNAALAAPAGEEPPACG